MTWIKKSPGLQHRQVTSSSSRPNLHPSCKFNSDYFVCLHLHTPGFMLLFAWGLLCEGANWSSLPTGSAHGSDGTGWTADCLGKDITMLRTICFWDQDLRNFVIFIVAILKMKNTELCLNILITDTMTKIDHNCRKFEKFCRKACRILGDKRAILSQTPIARQLWSKPWIVDDNSQELLVITHWESKGCGWRRGCKAGQHISGTNVLVLAPGDEHNTAQHKGRDEAAKRAWTVRGDQHHQRCPKPSDPFPESSRGMNCTGLLICIESEKLIFKMGRLIKGIPSKPTCVAIPRIPLLDQCWS